MSVMTTCRAPACLQIGIAMQPIGPAPVMSTSSPTRSNESAVCTALPSGSKHESTSSGIDESACQQFDCGIATNSAHAPGDSRPRLAYSDKDDAGQQGNYGNVHT